MRWKPFSCTKIVIALSPFYAMKEEEEKKFPSWYEMHISRVLLSSEAETNPYFDDRKKPFHETEKISKKITSFSVQHWYTFGSGMIAANGSSAISLFKYLICHIISLSFIMHNKYPIKLFHWLGTWDPCEQYEKKKNNNSRFVTNRKCLQQNVFDLDSRTRS